MKAKLWRYFTFLYAFGIGVATIILLLERISYGYPPVVAVGAFMVPFGILLALTSRWLFAFTVSGTLLIVVKFCNQMKIHYYKEQLMFSDLNLLTDTSNFGTLAHYWLAGLGFLAYIFWVFASIFISWNIVGKGSWKGRVTGIGLAAVGALASSIAVSKYHEDWETRLPKGTGTLANVVMSSQSRHHKPPVYTEPAAYFTSMMESVNLPQAQHEIKPDIILLLQESTVDPAVFSLPEGTVLPELSIFAATENVVARGPLRVQTFGGGTWLSEFSVLGGLNTDDFASRKNAVFYFIVDHLRYSFVKELKANGYYTAVLTPFNKSAYNAGHAYKQLGFDRVIQPQELGYPAEIFKNLWTITTAEMLDYAKQILESETDKPVFLFVLTMAEHGPYEASHSDDYQLTDKTGRDTAGRFSHYMAKIRTSDTAIRQFSEFLMGRERPTMLLCFGDHQPHLGLSDYAPGQDRPTHVTQFVLYDNLQDGQNIEASEITDISFLGGIILERSKLPVSPFYRANMAMRHLGGGKLDEAADKKLTNSYKNYLYQELQATGPVDKK